MNSFKVYLFVNMQKDLKEKKKKRKENFKNSKFFIYIRNTKRQKNLSAKKIFFLKHNI